MAKSRPNRRLAQFAALGVPKSRFSFVCCILSCMQQEKHLRTLIRSILSESKKAPLPKEISYEVVVPELEDKDEEIADAVQQAFMRAAEELQTQDYEISDKHGKHRLGYEVLGELKGGKVR